MEHNKALRNSTYFFKYGYRNKIIKKMLVHTSRQFRSI